MKIKLTPMPMLMPVQGDITTIPVDAIVNAANATLLGGGGVDGAIHRAGGPQILEECQLIRAKQGGCKTGEAVITTAGKLPAKYVIHTVGPIWGDGNEEAMLTKAYWSSLQLAAQHQVQSISFPNISTGAYGFPKDRAAEIAVGTVNTFLKDHPMIKKVLFVCYDAENLKLYQGLLTA